MRLVSAIYRDYYPFDNMPMFNEFINTSDPEVLQHNDVLIVWGGEDIHPMLYNHRVHPYTGVWNETHLSKRDSIEWALMLRAKDLGIPIIGICRGAQMLCALAGGWLIQDVNYHAGVGEHEVITYDNKRLITNSLHHQMMYPFGVDHHMVAWTKPLTNVYNFADESKIITKPADWLPINPEFVYFPKVKGFAIQWHPEYTDFPDEATQYCFNYIESVLTKDKVLEHVA